MTQSSSSYTCVFHICVELFADEAYLKMIDIELESWLRSSAYHVRFGIHRKISWNIVMNIPVLWHHWLCDIHPSYSIVCMSRLLWVDLSIPFLQCRVFVWHSPMGVDEHEHKWLHRSMMHQIVSSSHHCCSRLGWYHMSKGISRIDNATALCSIIDPCRIFVLWRIICTHTTSGFIVIILATIFQILDSSHTPAQ